MLKLVFLCAFLATAEAFTAVAGFRPAPALRASAPQAMIAPDVTSSVSQLIAAGFVNPKDAKAAAAAKAKAGAGKAAAGKAGAGKAALGKGAAAKAAAAKAAAAKAAGPNVALLLASGIGFLFIPLSVVAVIVVNFGIMKRA